MVRSRTPDRPDKAVGLRDGSCCPKGRGRAPHHAPRCLEPGSVRRGPRCGVVVDDVDAALAALFAASKAKDQKLACAFDAPTPEWSAKVKSPTLNLFLVQINENLDARPGALGRRAGRQRPDHRSSAAASPVRPALRAQRMGRRNTESNTGCSGRADTRTRIRHDPGRAAVRIAGRARAARSASHRAGRPRRQRDRHLVVARSAGASVAHARRDRAAAADARDGSRATGRDARHRPRRCAAAEGTCPGARSLGRRTRWTRRVSPDEDTPQWTTYRVRERVQD